MFLKGIISSKWTKCVFVSLASAKYCAKVQCEKRKGNNTKRRVICHLSNLNWVKVNNIYNDYILQFILSHDFFCLKFKWGYTDFYDLTNMLLRRLQRNYIALSLEILMYFVQKVLRQLKTDLKVTNPAQNTAKY